MSKGLVNLQDNFLNQVRKENIGVTIYLVSGVQLKGYVRGFDSFTVVLETPGKPAQIVYKHAIASVVPSQVVRDLMSMQRDDRPADDRPAQPQPAEERPEQPAPEMPAEE